MEHFGCDVGTRDSEQRVNFDLQFVRSIHGGFARLLEAAASEALDD